jgi:hypothetical protein
VLEHCGTKSTQAADDAVFFAWRSEKRLVEIVNVFGVFLDWEMAWKSYTEFLMIFMLFYGIFVLFSLNE